MAEQQRAVNPQTGEVWILVGDKWVPEPKAEKQNAVWGALGQLNQGLLAGYNDEVQAAMRHPVSALQHLLPGVDGGDEYRAEQRRQEQAQHEYALQHPVISSTARAVGATAPAAAAVATGGASLLPGMAGRSGGLLSGMREAAGWGAAAGGVNALGEAPAPTSQSEALGQAAVGTAEGAVLGAGLSAGIAGASRLLREPARRLAEYVRATVGGTPTAAPAASVAPQVGSGAQRRALADIEAAGMTPEGVREGLAAGRGAGVPTTIADVGGNPLQRTLRGIRTADPGAGNLIDTRLTGSARGQEERVAGALERGLGVQPVAPGATVDALAAAKARLAAPHFSAARGAGRLEDEAVLRDLWDGANVYAPAHEEARQLMISSSKGQRVPPPLYGPEGNLLRTPDIRDIELIKRGVDARLYNNARGRVDPKNALDAEAQRNLQLAMRNTDPAAGPLGLLPTVDRLVPEYGTARGIYAGHSRMQDIVEEGQEIWKRSAEDIGRYVQGLENEGERQLLRSSVLQNLQTRIRAAADKADAANVLNEVFGWGHGLKGDKLRQLFPSDRAFAEFRATAEAELNAVRSRRTIQSGSNTMDKAVDVAGVVGEGGRAVADAASGNTHAILNSAVGLGRRVAGSFSDTRGELADILTSSTGAEADDFLRILEQLRADRIARMTGRPRTNALALAAGTGSTD